VSTVLWLDGVLLSGSADGNLCRWSADGAELSRTRLGYGQIWALCRLGHSEVVAATQSGKVLLLDPTCDVKLVLSAHTAEARAVAALGDSCLVTGDTSGHLVVWRKRRCGRWKGSVLTSQAFPFGAVQMCSVSPSTVAIAHGEDHVMLVDVERDTCRELRGHRGPVWAVGTGPEGTVLSGGYDGTARLWSAGSGPDREICADHLADVSSVVALSSELLLTGDGGGAIQLWRFADGRRVARAVLDQPVDCVDVAPGLSRIAVGHANGAITVLELPAVVSGLDKGRR
jgi:WD40 repeat protein